MRWMRIYLIERDVYFQTRGLGIWRLNSLDVSQNLEQSESRFKDLLLILLSI